MQRRMYFSSSLLLLSLHILLSAISLNISSGQISSLPKQAFRYRKSRACFPNGKISGYVIMPAHLYAPHLRPICSAPPPLFLRFYRSGAEAEQERSKTAPDTTETLPDIRSCFDFIPKSFYPAFLSLFSVFLPVHIRHIARYAKERTDKNPQKYPLEKCRNKIRTASKYMQWLPLILIHFTAL